MQKAFKAEALVLKKIKKGEADILYTLITRKYGIIKAVARGIRKINSKRAPHFDIFNHLLVFFVKGNIFDIITDVTPLNNFQQLKKNLNKVASAFKIAELTERLLPEREENDIIFDRLLESMGNLNKEKNTDEKLILEKFCLQLLHYLGFLPKSQVLKGKELDIKLEEIMERKIKANLLISKLI